MCLKRSHPSEPTFGVWYPPYLKVSLDKCPICCRTITGNQYSMKKISKGLRIVEGNPKNLVGRSPPGQRRGTRGAGLLRFGGGGIHRWVASLGTSSSAQDDRDPRGNRPERVRGITIGENVHPGGHEAVGGHLDELTVFQGYHVGHMGLHSTRLLFFLGSPTHGCI